MAERATSLPHIVFVLAFSLYIQSSVSYDTAVLDVSATIKKTLDILTFTVQEKTLINSSLTSSLSLSLHSRSSIFNSRHKNYESLAHSRFARDSARVNSILAQVNLSAPVISANSQGSGEYFARIGIGSPPKYYYWIIDTGSDISWLQCLPCDSCYQQSDPVYDPSDSSTYHSLSCESTQCQALDGSFCSADSCQYEVSYGDGSYTTGDLATETLSFGSVDSVSDLSIGCGHDNEGLFVGSAGLIGLGGGALSLSSQLNAESFSYCLVDRDSTGSSTLEFDSGRLADSVSTPLIRNTQYMSYRYIQIVDMSVGGKRLNIPSSLFEVDYTGRGGTVIDSGTTVTRLKRQAYNILRDEFVRQTRNLRRTSGYENIFDTCYSLSRGKTLVPTVSFNFPENQTLVLPVENILIPIDSRGKFCFAFAASDSLSIIGNIQQQTIRVNYDLVNNVVEFSSKQC